MTIQTDKSIKPVDDDKELQDIEKQIELLEQKKADRLRNVTQYVQSGKSFRAILYSHTDVVNGKLARINVLGDKMDQSGKKVERQPRKTTTTKKSRKA